MQAVPNTPGSAVFVESTANGVSGEFYNLWQGAVRGENGFIPIFIPWFVTAEYRETVPPEFERTPVEEELVEKYGLDDEQLMFRRRKVAQNGVELWQQEYPSNADEAFLTTGRPVFDTNKLAERIRTAPEPIGRMGLIGNEFTDDPRGELLVYRAHDPSETYYIGADVAMGVRGGDYSVAQVLDSHKRQVAVWRGHINPDYFATTLHRLGLYYNIAKIAVESNNHGILTCTRLGKDLAYPAFYTETVVDKLEDRETINLGFRTTVKTKPLIIDELRAVMRDEEIEVYDKTTLRELQTFIVTDTGTMEAEEGLYDDTVMSLAICNHIHEGRFEAVVSSDEYYVTPI